MGKHRHRWPGPTWQGRKTCALCGAERCQARTSADIWRLPRCEHAAKPGTKACGIKAHQRDMEVVS